MFRPRLPQRAVGFASETDRYEPGVNRILDNSDGAQEHNRRRERLCVNVKIRPENYTCKRAGDESRGPCCGGIEQNRAPALTEMQSRAQSVDRSDDHRRFWSIKKKCQEDEAVSDGYRRIHARNFDGDA